MHWKEELILQINNELEEINSQLTEFHWLPWGSFHGAISDEYCTMKPISKMHF